MKYQELLKKYPKVNKFDVQALKNAVEANLSQVIEDVADRSGIDISVLRDLIDLKLSEDLNPALLENISVIRRMDHTRAPNDLVVLTADQNFNLRVEIYKDVVWVHIYRL